MTTIHNKPNPICQHPFTDAFGLRKPAGGKVDEFRTGCLNNGYPPLAVLDNEKRPAGAGWQLGHSRARLIPARPGETNTGILAAGFRAIDVDIDDATKADAVRKAVEKIAGPTIARVRQGSSRKLLVYAAAAGEPPKQVMQGDGCKVEILGNGQQFVADGVHPDGSRYEWEGGRGPHTVQRASLPKLSEAQVASIVEAVQSIIGTAPSPTKQPSAIISSLSGSRPTIFDGRANLPKLNDAAQAGLPVREWFADLAPDAINDLLRKIFALPGIAALTDAPRDEWLRLLFGAAHAEHLGATEARQIALDWSRPGKTFNEDQFAAAWASFRADRV